VIDSSELLRHDMTNLEFKPATELEVLEMTSCDQWRDQGVSDRHSAHLRIQWSMVVSTNFRTLSWIQRNKLDVKPIIVVSATMPTPRHQSVLR
jgi:hypothetical protein